MLPRRTKAFIGLLLITRAAGAASAQECSSPFNVAGAGDRAPPIVVPVLPSPPIPPTPVPSQPPSESASPRQISDFSGLWIGGGVASEWSHRQPYGGLVGISAGFNAQFECSVFGVGGDIDAYLVQSGLPYWSESTLVRYGYVVSDGVLPFAEIGPTLINARNPGGGASTLGLKIGAGVDFKVGQALSVKIEFDRVIVPSTSQFARNRGNYNDQVRAVLEFFLPTGAMKR